MSKTTYLLLILTAFILTQNRAFAADPLTFDPGMHAPERTLDFPDGKSVKYRAYEHIYYVTHVVDPVYQTLNLYVPESAYENHTQTPIFLKTNVGGYMASKASQPSATDATGRALLEGYIVVMPGARGSNSTVIRAAGDTLWTGRAPAGLIDLKSAIRYLRHNKATIPGDTEKIITDGTSAGGAMSSLLGATGNHPAYEPYLKAVGAANERDDVFAAVCYCPITDLGHADMAYEWLYNLTNTGTRSLSPEQIAISNALAASYPAYLNSLNLRKPDDTPLTADNYTAYMKSFLIRSAQKARNEGCEIPPETGVKLNSGFRGSPGEFVVDIDLDLYFNYILSKRQLKTPPAFDQSGVLIDRPSPENSVFGDETGNAVNFTAFSLQKATGHASATPDPSIIEKVRLMNPMSFIGDGISRTTPNWYIRHGAIDRDTGFQISINLYTKLINNGYNVDFALPWNRGHSGDYNLDDLFEWMKEIL